MSQVENDGVFTAGQVVLPGMYRRVDVPNGRLIELARPEALPASLDGTIATYRRVVQWQVREAVGSGVRGKPLTAID